MTEMIGDRLGNKIVLGLLALLVAIHFALLLGIVAGTREERKTDQAITSASLAIVAIPEFVIGAILIVVFSFALAGCRPCRSSQEENLRSRIQTSSSFPS